MECGRFPPALDGAGQRGSIPQPTEPVRMSMKAHPRHECKHHVGKVEKYYRNKNNRLMNGCGVCSPCCRCLTDRPTCTLSKTLLRVAGPRTWRGSSHHRRASRPPPGGYHRPLCPSRSRVGEDFGQPGSGEHRGRHPRGEFDARRRGMTLGQRRVRCVAARQPADAVGEEEPAGNGVLSTHGQAARPKDLQSHRRGSLGK